MKILHLISTLDTGGAEQNLFRLITAMNKTYFQNYPVSMIRPGIVGYNLECKGVQVHSLNMKKGVPDLRSILRLRFMTSLIRPDIIQCWMYHANLMGLTIMDFKRTLWGIRCSDMDLDLYGPVYRFTVKSGMKLSGIPSMVVTNSHAGRNTHQKLGFHPKKWAIIPNGFDTRLFKPDKAARGLIRSELNIPEKDFVIGLIARLDPMKDHGTFFKAARMFLSSNPSAHFILAGKGLSSSDERILSIAGDIVQTGRINLLGERHDIPQIMNALDIATLSSLSEGLPNTIGEAMATGIPCVATDAGDSSLLVGDSGVIIQKSDPSALCTAWQHLLNAGSAYRKNLGISARQRIIDHYSLTSMVQAYEDLYKSIIIGRES